MWENLVGFVIIDIVSGHPDRLAQGPDHTVALGISLQHFVNLGLWHYILYLLKEVFSHGRQYTIKALNGLDIGSDELIQQLSS